MAKEVLTGIGILIVIVIGLIVLTVLVAFLVKLIEELMMPRSRKEMHKGADDE